MADETVQNFAGKEVIRFMATLLTLATVGLVLVYVLGGTVMDVFGLFVA